MNFNNLLFIFMVIKIGDGTPLMLSSEDRNKSIILCEIDNVEFWKFYNWHFKNATSIYISLIFPENPTFTEMFLSKMLTYLFQGNKFKRSFTIENLQLNYSTEDEDAYYDIEFPEHESTEEENFRDYDTNFYKLQKLRRNSGEPENAYLFITWGVKDFTLFLQNMYINIIKNPRASYIILFISPEYNNDIELQIKTILDLLWKRYGILNVIVKLPCSELHEIVFKYNPFVFNTTWGSLEQFRIANALLNPRKYRNYLRNMHEYPVPISIFPRRPSAIKKLPRGIRDNKIYDILKKSGGFGGVDGVILANIASFLNFSVSIKIPPADREYGYSVNGTFVGSLGDVVYNYVAASFNARFMSDYDTNAIEFTTPISNDFLCLLVPNAEKKPQWLMILQCFTLTAWISIFALYVTVSYYWYLTKDLPMMFTDSTKKRVSDRVDAFFEVFTLFFSVSNKCFIIPNQRIFIVVCMVFNIIFVGTFQGSLYNSYTKKSYYPNINTLEQLDESGLSIVTSSQSFVNIFGTDPIPVMSRLKKKLKILNGTSSLGKAAFERDGVAFERKADAKFRIETEYTRRRDGFELLHVMQECPWVYYVAFILPKGSPYLPVFNVLITTFREAGLITKWRSDTVEAMIMEQRVNPTDESDILKPFTMRDVQAAFYLITFGLVLSLIVFVVEILVKYFATD